MRGKMEGWKVTKNEIRGAGIYIIKKGLEVWAQKMEIISKGKVMEVSAQVVSESVAIVGVFNIKVPDNKSGKAKV